MKRFAIALGLAALLASPASAGGLGGMVAYWSTDEAGGESGPGLKLELDFNNPWDLEIRWSLFEELERVSRGLRFPIQATPVDFGLAYNYSRDSKVNPYLGGGLSYVLVDSDFGEMPDELGYYGVAGVEFEVYPRLAIFVEGLYRQVEAEIEGNDLQSFVKVPVDLSGAGANLGLLYRW